MNRLLRLTADLALLYRRCGFSRSAAALAYFLILTLFPLLLCVSHVIGVFHLDLAPLLQPLGQLLPEDAFALLQDYLAYAAASRSAPLFWAGLFTIVVSASAGLRTLLHTMDELYGHTPRHPLLRFALSLGLSLFLLGTIYLSVALLFTGDWFFRLLEGAFPSLAALGGLWRRVRYGLLFCSMLVLVLVVYRAGTPRSAANGKRLLVSSVAAALALVVCSAAFSWFLELSARYRLVYGSLAGLILLLVWLYACGLILLLGAALCRVQDPL